MLFMKLYKGNKKEKKKLKKKLPTYRPYFFAALNLKQTFFFLA